MQEHDRDLAMDFLSVVGEKRRLADDQFPQAAALGAARFLGADPELLALDLDSGFRMGSDRDDPRVSADRTQ